MSKYKDGEPRSHPGCLRHITHPCEGCGRIAGKFDYTTLLARHNALVEAVAWERECECFDRWATHTCQPVTYEWDQVIFAARAEVDRLIANESETRPGDNGYGVVTEHDLD